MLDFETIERDRAERRAYWRQRNVYTDRAYADAIRDGVQAGGGQKLIFHSRTRPLDIVTVAEVDAEAERFARAFHRLGLRCGDYIAVMLPTWRETALAYLAAFKIGLAVVPIVPVYGAREIGFVMRETGAKALIVPDRWRGFDYLERVEAAGGLPDMRWLIVVGEAEGDGIVRWSDLTAEPGDIYPAPSGIADEVCLVIYTSGTTSDPKGVKHTHNTMLCDNNAARAGLEPAMPAASPPGAVFGMSPAGHMAGFHTLIRPFVNPGADTVYVDQWAPEEAVALIERYGIGSAAGTPIFLTSLVDTIERGEVDISSLKAFGLGGSAVTPDTIRVADSLGLEGWRVYGMSEHSNVSASLGDTFEKRAYTDGKITARNEVLIVDDNDEEVPRGQPGEVCTRGPRLFVGYMNPDLDRACFLPGGWYKSGDIGTHDADGYLTITDRKKDIIIRGGENISAKEVEDVLATMPGVRESAVVAMPDPALVERVCAFVEAKPGHDISLESVTAYFREQGVARLKTPERVILVEAFERTATGKVRKTDLRQQLRDEAAAG